MFDERVYEIKRLILNVFWFYNMKQWRFEEVWGFEKLGFVDLDCFRSPKYRYTFSFWLKPLKSKHSSIRYKHLIRKFVAV
ncbi:hypothetical protein HanXRQr2_Chr14g0647641 [Helianthus annuus]|uniref:Uncharacterized protein n=1 Tax=Helianthus annuus TaxID=4232 RepID=A0A251SLM4_HELAN|nr:hypothetical protein HanXRQr2_Chr14g0647641 [Helianthus annuus]